MPKKKHRTTLSEAVDLAIEAVHSVTRKSESPSSTTKRAGPFSAPQKRTKLARKSEFVPIWDLHIKHPPYNPLPLYGKPSLPSLPSLYRDGEVDEFGRIPLDREQFRFNRTQDPLVVLEAFIMAHEEKLYPPLWVLDFLFTAFNKYLKGQGSLPLDHYLGIGGKSKQGSRFQQRRKEARDSMLAIYITWYIGLKKCSVEKAAERVAIHWNAGLKEGLYKFGEALDRPLDTDTLMQYYVRGWRKKYLCDEEYLGIQSRLRSLTKEERQSFLAKFEEDTFNT